MLSMIQRGSVTIAYFQDLANALKHARIQGSVIFAALNEIDNPDILAELADLYLRREGTTWTLCSGVYRGKLWLSLRTSQSDAKAGTLMQKMVSGLGTGGGHDMSAGGQIPLTRNNRQERETARKTIHDKLLRHVGADKNRSRKLVEI
jgi:nanoRNase/pAp phosphatase (c-di-AMP/oligoRNAs hydrolase)